MLINSIFSENYLDEMEKADLILKLQLFINTDAPYDPQKKPLRKFKSSKEKDDEEEDPRSLIISNILDHCLDICEPVTMFGSSMVYKGIYDKSAFKVAALISVYNTICELIYSEHKAIGYSDISELLDKIHMTIDGMYKKNHSFKLDESGYIHKSINKHINSETKSHKKISYFAYNTSILLMDRYSEFKLDKWKNAINKCSRWDKLEKNILNYDVFTDKVISNLNIFENNEESENFKNYEALYLINKYSLYINNIYAFETIINKYLYEDILKFALYLLYCDYDLNDYLINTLVKFIDMPSVYSRNQLLFFFLFKLKGNINDFEYFETLNSSNVGMKIEVNEYVTKDAIYSHWINNLETARKLFTGTVIPVFENALFILLYKYFNDKNHKETPENVLIKMKTEIEWYLINHTDTIFREDKFDIYKNGDDLFISKNPINKSEAVSIIDLLEMVKRKKNPLHKEGLKKLVYKFFDYMDTHPQKQQYNLTEETFDLRSAVLSKNEQNVFVGPIIANLVKGRCHVMSKTDN